MILQLSSGQGPAECELAVCKLYETLCREYPDIKLLDQHAAHTPGCCTSIRFQTECDLSALEGSILWICQSPFRPHHKRKNWFVDVSILDRSNSSAPSGQKDADDLSVLPDADLHISFFHCGGKGGQNVNKVATGVRLTHIPTGLCVTSTAQRSQQQNRQDALLKLKKLLRQQKLAEQEQAVNAAWREHTRIVRGDPVRTYTGMAFLRKA